MRPINPKDFVLSEIPKYHPKSYKYLEFWKAEKRKCIEGYWSSGRWMPGRLYFYVNYGTILLNKNPNDKYKSPDRPFLRDLEWEFFYYWEEAKGFSGFELDQNYTCHRLAKQDVFDNLRDFEKSLFIKKNPECFNQGKLKIYIEASEYLRKTHFIDLGKPLYNNQSKDLMMMGSRGFGKSYSVGVGIIAHNFLFDGAIEYIDPLNKTKEVKNPISSTIVGAGESKYSSSLLDKTAFALDNLPGSQEINGKFYPCPFAKQYTGSWASGKDITAAYKKKLLGRWEDGGSKSKIYHRTFMDNPFAANGLRADTQIYEEIGMFSNLLESRNASLECLMNGSNKYGSAMFLGTGGDMDKGTIDASMMFNDPESFGLVACEDIWENTGKIGYFVPAYKGLNEYKDEFGFTIEEPAKEYLKEFRENLRSKKNGAQAIDEELQNRPLKPSEAFLTKKGNIFPIDALNTRLIALKQDNVSEYLEKIVNLYFDKESPTGVNYSIDLSKELLPLNNYPLNEKQKNNREGCVTIYEFPIEIKGKVPSDLYIIGHDPYASDEDGNSLGVSYVLKNKKYFKEAGYDEIVASYIGRPFNGRKIYNENLYKLSLLYGGAKIFFENIRGNVVEYFEKIKRLDLLAEQPTTVLTSKKSKIKSKGGAVIYGYPISNLKFKKEGVQYVRDWLIEERGLSNGKIVRNLDLLPDKGLIQELISFNYDGNFDRVMAFIGCIIGREETTNEYIKEEKKVSNKLLFLKKKITRHSNIWNHYQNKE